MEDESIYVPTLKFVLLKSETNSYIKEDNDWDKEVKEINKNLFKNMMHEKYENTNFEEE